jgi:hypothetical protein
MTTQQNLWPYSEASGIIDPDLARSIREWALSVMSEAELHTLSQRQALRLYINQHIVPTLDRVIGRQRSPEQSSTLAKAAVDRGDLFGFPLKAQPSASLDPRVPARGSGGLALRPSAKVGPTQRRSKVAQRRRRS